MLYLALGASLLQHLLSIGRLAPLQLSFGLGHPVTSGHEGVDFFVSSDLFETAQETDQRGGPRHEEAYRNKRAQATAAAAAVAAAGTISGTSQDSYSRGTHGGNGTFHLSAGQQITAAQLREASPSTATENPAMIYAEQVALFDSFTGVFHPPRDPNPARVMSIRNRILSLATSAGLAQKHVDPAAVRSTEDGRDHDHDARFGSNQPSSPTGSGPEGPSRRQSHEGGEREERRDGAFDENGRYTGNLRLYHCLQDVKKFHPAFDVAMRGVLENDPGALLLIPSGAKIHSERWNRTLGPGGAERLLFLSEMEHPVIMEVVAGCDVMLAPWGWGAGITSFEALSVGLPVVTLPIRESVLHFSMGQVRVYCVLRMLDGRDKRGGGSPLCCIWNGHIALSNHTCTYLELERYSWSEAGPRFVVLRFMRHVFCGRVRCGVCHTRFARIRPVGEANTDG